MDAYLPILLLMVVLVVAVTALYGASRWLAGTATPLAGDPYLSGLGAREHALSRFHVRWYYVGLLFLAFDMEMAFMYPWAVVFVDIGLTALVEMGMFLLILTLGILYAWREGALRWA